MRGILVEVVERVVGDAISCSIALVRLSGLRRKARLVTFEQRCKRTVVFEITLHSRGR